MFNHLGDPSYEAIPGETLVGLDRWGAHGVPTGDFLRAVLVNDLFQACGRADPFNAAALWAIVRYIWNELPSQCHGSPEKVEAWAALKLAEGKSRDPAMLVEMNAP